jgi:unsaturated rhamnogalacturonyl hydrolase
MVAYINALQKANGTDDAGLFWHTKDSHAHWGRANGWVASGMTELLKELPAASSDRAAIMSAYAKQMDALLKFQISDGSDKGCWRQVIDVSSAAAESSCTAMFTYALVAGVKYGWLTDSKYVTAAKNGWTAVAAKTTSSGQLDKVCPGTGQPDNAAGISLQQQQQFYTSITLAGPGDLHGQAPLLWSAIELVTSECHGGR